jgi:hypothetical protein
MRRLLRICFDLSLLSFIPIISWFLLGIIVDKNLINIFTLTYPLQYIYYIIKSIFSTGAGISKEKDNNEDAVMSGLVVGTFIAGIIFIIILFNVDNYIKFMNMSVNIYKTFTIYSIIQLFITLVFSMIQNKLYYEGKNKIANKNSLIFNILNFILLIGTSLITKNQVIIAIATLIPLSLFTLYIYMDNCNKFKFKINLFKWIRYDSAELFNNFAYLIIFLFGLSNTLEYGEVYALALTFVSLITDTQWDTIDAMVVAANIDISKNEFNYIEHINNAYKLTFILIGTSLIMFGILYWFYELDLGITILYFSFEIIYFLLYPMYRIKICYLQLEYSAWKTTTNKIIASILRIGISLMDSPFCTGIGQVCSSVYQFVSVNAMFYLNYKINKKGIIVKKRKKCI